MLLLVVGAAALATHRFPNVQRVHIVNQLLLSGPGKANNSATKLITAGSISWLLGIYDNDIPLAVTIGYDSNRTDLFAPSSSCGPGPNLAMFLNGSYSPTSTCGLATYPVHFNLASGLNHVNATIQASRTAQLADFWVSFSLNQ